MKNKSLIIIYLCLILSSLFDSAVIPRLSDTTDELAEENLCEEYCESGECVDGICHNQNPNPLDEGPGPDFEYICEDYCVEGQCVEGECMSDLPPNSDVDGNNENPQEETEIEIINIEPYPIKDDLGAFEDEKVSLNSLLNEEENKDPASYSEEEIMNSPEEENIKTEPPSLDSFLNEDAIGRADDKIDLEIHPTEEVMNSPEEENIETEAPSLDSFLHEGFMDRADENKDLDSHPTEEVMNSPEEENINAEPPSLDSFLNEDVSDRADEKIDLDSHQTEEVMNSPEEEDIKTEPPMIPDFSVPIEGENLKPEISENESSKIIEEHEKASLDSFSNEGAIDKADENIDLDSHSVEEVINTLE